MKQFINYKISHKIPYSPQQLDDPIARYKRDKNCFYAAIDLALVRAKKYKKDYVLFSCGKITNRTYKTWFAIVGAGSRPPKDTNKNLSSGYLVKKNGEVSIVTFNWN